MFILILALLLPAFSPSAQAKALQIGVIADMNGTGCQTKYPANSLQAFEQLLANHQLDHIIMTGDAAHGECMSYKGGIPYQTVAKNMWEEFDKKFIRPAREKEGSDLILAPGNHDAPFLSASSRETFRLENVEFVNFWRKNKPNLKVEAVTAPGVSDNYPYYWAYTYENVLFLVLQSTRTYSLGNAVEQKKWLRAILKTPAAQKARAKIAFGHVPPYPVLDPSVGGKYKETISNEQVGKANGLMDLLLDNNVDMLLVGHSHAPYPGQLKRKSDGKKIKIISMPCGHAPRKLFGKSELSPRGFAVLEITEQNAINVSLKNYSDGKAIPLSYFPASLPLNDPKITYERMK